MHIKNFFYIKNISFILLAFIFNKTDAFIINSNNLINAFASLFILNYFYYLKINK